MKAEPTPLRSAAEIRAARFDLVSRLADDLAHEIKNPLHAMVINLEVLRRRVANGATADALERADVLAHELQRVNRLVEQMLLLVRPDRGGIRVVDVDELLEEIVPVIEIRARAGRKEFRFEPAGGDGTISIASDMLRLALLAAAEWAFTTAPADGAVVVRCTTTAAGVAIAVQAHGAALATLSTAAAEAALSESLAFARACLHEGGGDADATDAPDGGYVQIVLSIPRAAGA